MVALLAVRLGLPLDAADGALATALMAGVVMDTATFAHPNATPRTLARGRGAARRRRAAVRTSRGASTAPSRTPSCACSAACSPGSRARPTAGSSGPTLRVGDLAAHGRDAADSEGIIDLLAQSETAEVAILFKEQADGRRGSASAPGPAASTRPC